MKIKEIVDSLSAVGALVSVENHIEVILNGLNEEYSAFIIAIVSRSEPYSIEEIEGQLMAQEEKIEIFKKMELNSMQAHLAHASIQDPRTVRRGNGGRRKGKEHR